VSYKPSGDLGILKFRYFLPSSQTSPPYGMAVNGKEVIFKTHFMKKSDQKVINTGKSRITISCLYAKKTTSEFCEAVYHALRHLGIIENIDKKIKCLFDD
jgi:hypothetical protein